MADQNVIREFLVSLGWKIDDKGERRFVETVEKSTKRVIALGTAATGQGGIDINEAICLSHLLPLSD